MKTLLRPNEQPTLIIPKEDTKDTTFNEKYLLKCLKTDLVLLCKSKGLKTTGTNNELISYLLDSSHNNNEAPPSKDIPEIEHDICMFSFCDICGDKHIGCAIREYVIKFLMFKNSKTIFKIDHVDR